VRRTALLLVLAACTVQSDARERRIEATLAADNYAWARRDPELVRLKLRKMQRGPFEWLRGTTALYWRDLMDPAPGRPATSFGDPDSTRVLLIGDPHVENMGTFRAADGTMFLDWNDFDATGYGPFTGDLRRLGASLAVVAMLGAPDGLDLAPELIHEAATSYAATIALQASGVRLGTIGIGATELLDKELNKAKTRGDEHLAVEEVAPVVAARRQLKIGDLEPVADDGVIEDRILPLDPEQTAWVNRAIDQWRATPAGADAGAIKLRCRRIGAGVASYAALRFDVVLEGPTLGEQNDVLVELKETRDGLVFDGVPRLSVAEWATPAVRAVNTQHRLQARPDADARLGHGEIGALSLKIRDREAYQRGMDATDLEELAQKDRAQLRTIVGIYGALLARAHGQALTADGVPGYTVIAPLLAGREAAFADEITTMSLQDGSQVFGDYERMKDRDLGAVILP
jgi:uncharacterized protein (DUF2252 family)